MTPKGFAFACCFAVSRTQRAVAGFASVTSTRPPGEPVAVWTVCQVRPSAETSRVNATAQLDSTSQPVVFRNGLIPDAGVNTGSAAVASNTRTTDSIRQAACRSTAIHCGSPAPARQPEPFTPVSARPSTANHAGVGAYAVEDTVTGR